MAGKGVSFEDRRRGERHVVRGVSGTLHVSTHATILNMSMTGMAVQVDIPLSVGRRYSITFRRTADTTLRLAGSVVWCRPRATAPADAAGAVHEAGLRFDHTLGQRAADLARVLQAVSRAEVSKRISGRFRVDAEESVDLHAALDLAARDVSTAGILVETDELVPPGTVVDAELRLREHALRVRGRIARIREATGARGESVRQLGIEFVEASQDGRDAIVRFIDCCLERPAGEAAV